jgi:hypothetical protein
LLLDVQLFLLPHHGEDRKISIDPEELLSNLCAVTFGLQAIDLRVQVLDKPAALVERLLLFLKCTTLIIKRVPIA